MHAEKGQPEFDYVSLSIVDTRNDLYHYYFNFFFKLKRHCLQRITDICITLSGFAHYADVQMRYCLKKFNDGAGVCVCVRACKSERAR